MKLRSTALAVGLLAGVLSLAAPAQADSGNVSDLLDTLDGLSVTGVAPQDAVDLGKSLCPLLADRSQNTADIAAKVADAAGRPLGAPTAFTGLAVSFLCPKAIENVSNDLANGKLPFPLFGN